MYDEDYISESMRLAYIKFEQKNLKYLTSLFATKWSNIDPSRYFDYMFEDNMYNLDDIMKVYRMRDKQSKLLEHNLKETFVQSLKFVSSYMKKHDIKNFEDYCSLRDGNALVILTHFMKGYINLLFLTLMMRRRYVVFDDNDKASLSGYVTDGYRKMCYVLDEMSEFISESMSRFYRSLINDNKTTG
jgi:hypothetical protein